MTHQLTDGHVLFACRCELGPVGRHGLVVVEFAFLHQPSDADGRRALGGREDDDGGLFPPWFIRLVIRGATPNVHDPLTVDVHTGRGAGLVAVSEIVYEYLGHRFETFGNLAMYAPVSAQPISHTTDRRWQWTHRHILADRRLCPRMGQ